MKNYSALFCCCLTILFLCFTASAGFATKGNNENAKVELQPADRARTGIRAPSTKIRMPSHSLTVRTLGENSLGGRKVTVTIRKGRSSKSKTVSLNHTGDATISFPLGSVVPVVHGSYQVTVAKGPADVANYASTANYCFDGTTPASRTVTIDSVHREVTVEFTIRSSIAWNRQGYCW